MNGRYLRTSSVLDVFSHPNTLDAILNRDDFLILLFICDFFAKPVEDFARHSPQIDGVSIQDIFASSGRLMPPRQNN